MTSSKVIGGEKGNGSALQQLQDRGYAAKYADGENRVLLIGMEFSKVLRNMVGFGWLEG